MQNVHLMQVLNLVYFAKNYLQIITSGGYVKYFKSQKQVEKVIKGEVKFYNIAFNIIRDNLFFNEYLNQES